MFKPLLLLKISDERKPKIKGENENHRTAHSTILKYFHDEDSQFELLAGPAAAPTSIEYPPFDL